MNEDAKKEKTTQTPTLTELEKFGFQIPVCCREGHANCPHKAQKEIKVKTNVGL